MSFAATPDVDAWPDDVSCFVCGCTDLEACPEGCWWVEDPEGMGDLCSMCAEGGHDG